MAQRVIFHIDVNSAFLSWTAAYRVSVLGEPFDLREVPSVIAGDKASRHAIILAKALPPKVRHPHRGAAVPGPAKMPGAGGCQPGLRPVCGGLPAICPAAP